MTDIRRVACGAALVAGLFASACRAREAAPADAAQPVVVWRAVGSWSGRGNSQTESFTSDTGALRVRWETTPAAPAAKAGIFRLTAHSAISGRLLEQVVDHQGASHGVGYVNQDPHTFYMSVESADLSWKFSVEEGVVGQIVGESHR